MINTLFNDKWLKEFSVIPLNYNTKEVQNYCKLAETIWLEPIIGESFYEELLYQVKENQVSEENSTLLVEAIYPYLGFCVAYEALPSLIYHVNETSVTKGHSDNSDAVDLKEANFFENHLRRQIEARKDYLIKWLCSHCETYPIFNPKGICPCSCDDSCSGKLNNPKPMFTYYSTQKRCTELL